jgi:hypothetical protein
MSMTRLIELVLRPPAFGTHPDTAMARPISVLPAAARGTTATCRDRIAGRAGRALRRGRGRDARSCELFECLASVRGFARWKSLWRGNDAALRRPASAHPTAQTGRARLQPAPDRAACSGAQSRGDRIFLHEIRQRYRLEAARGYRCVASRDNSPRTNPEVITQGLEKFQEEVMSARSCHSLPGETKRTAIYAVE